MDFRTKVDNVLKAKGIKLWKLAELSGLGTTLEKAYNDNREMRDSSTVKFLQKVGISKTWWETQEGELLNNEVAEPGVDYDGPDPEKIYRKIVEGNTEYVLIHRTVLEEKYRLVAIEQILKDEKELERKDLQIAGLHEIIKMMASAFPVQAAKVEKAQ